MRVALCKSLDGIAGLEITERPDPPVEPGKVLVRVTAVGLNFADTLVLKGKYQNKPDLPFVPGAEIAGVVEAVGQSVAGISAGDRVMAYVGVGGAAERIVAEAGLLVRVPDAVPDVVAAGLSVTYGTAIHGLRGRGQVKPGETVVVTGAAGGAGQAAAEIAKLLGARVIAVASSPEKLELAKTLGADDAIQFPGEDLKERVRALTGGRGADVVYDCVGGEASEPLIRALAWQGRFLVVGFASGEIPKLPLNLLLVKGASAVGVFWGESVKRDQAAHRRDMEELLVGVAAGKLKPLVHITYPLERIGDALSVIENRQAKGKVVLTL